ncbi:hypothetical protein K432DRAFT_469828, partial [Lepidopterella palustris CBS 459.81]
MYRWFQVRLQAMALLRLAIRGSHVVERQISLTRSGTVDEASCDPDVLVAARRTSPALAKAKPRWREFDSISVCHRSARDGSRSHPKRWSSPIVGLSARQCDQKGLAGLFLGVFSKRGRRMVWSVGVMDVIRHIKAPSRSVYRVAFRNRQSVNASSNQNVAWQGLDTRRGGMRENPYS